MLFEHKKNNIYGTVCVGFYKQFLRFQYVPILIILISIKYSKNTGIGTFGIA